jgi:hypothetical protein
MAFIQPSSTNNKTLAKVAPIGGTPNIAVGSTNINLTTIDTGASASLKKAISANNTSNLVSGLALGGGAALLGSGVLGSAGKIASVASSAPVQALVGLTGLDKTAGNLVGSLRSALQSRLGTFDKAANGLASGISNRFAGVFKNRDVSSESTVPTQISDPVSSTLLSPKRPVATSFRVTGIQAGSAPITSGTVTQGSGSRQMTGTNLLTLASRFKSDISQLKNLPGTVANVFTKQKLTGLFSNALGQVVGNAAIDLFGKSEETLGGFLVNEAIRRGSQFGVKQIMGQVTKDSTKKASSNDLLEFNATVSPLAAATGSDNLSSFFVTNAAHTLIREDGSVVNTNNSGVDSTTANAILNVVRSLGCAVRDQDYMSANQADSLFGLGLLLAALEGMVDLVEDLLNCSRASSPMGQQLLGQIFGNVVGSQVGIAGSVIDKIDAPQSLNTPDLSISILTNPNLSASSKTTVDGLFTKLGTTTKDAMTVPGVSTSQYPVYNGALIPAINPGFTNAVFQSSTMTDYFQSRSMGVGADGKLKTI